MSFDVVERTPREAKFLDDCADYYGRNLTFCSSYAIGLILLITDDSLVDNWQTFPP
jgi:hypothetical protein